MLKIRVLLLSILFLPVNVLAQVTIAPTNLFLEENSRFGTFMVINGTNTPQEVTVEFSFGYFATDEDGNKNFVTDDEAMEQEYSIANNVRAFPQNFVLATGARQIVRLRINAPRDLEEKTYWARIETTTTAESPPVELGASESVSAEIGIKFKQITGLFYKVGNTTTGIEIDNITSDINREEGKLFVKTNFQKLGNSPFLGTVNSRIMDSSGKEVLNSSLSTSFYVNSIHAQEFDISDLPNGTYTVNVEFVTERNDISESDLVQMSPVTSTTTFSIQ
jgi:hypothetical protein